MGIEIFEYSLRKLDNKRCNMRLVSGMLRPARLRTCDETEIRVWDMERTACVKLLTFFSAWQLSCIVVDRGKRTEKSAYQHVLLVTNGAI